MSQQVTATRAPRRRLSLSQFISLLLALAAIVPLLATIGSIEVFLRPALISQVSSAMESDVQKRVQSIDAYLVERLNDIQSLSQSTPVKDLLSGNAASRNLVYNALFTAQHRDVANYISWSVINTQGKVALSYPTAPTLHGKYLILPEALQQLQHSGKVIISDVFYDQASTTASVDLYARVLNDNFGILGYVRASLSFSRIWQPVNSETQVNGAGSYGFILDQNGMRIAFTDPTPLATTRPASLFKAVAGLSQQTMQRIKDDNLYGGNANASTMVQADPTLAAMQSSANPPATFEITPAGQSQVYQAARADSTIVPWSYYLFRPLNAVTGIADQQILSVLLIVTFFLVIAVLVGLTTGRRITLPILRSVISLRKNSQSLKSLANDGHMVVNEQTWMVEASQAGLQAVRYYTNASRIAAERINAISSELVRDMSHLDARKLDKALKEISGSAQYIERAVEHQGKMNEKLITTLRVTTQATEQLTKDAEATEYAATQLEYIVNQLTSVVGERDIDTLQPTTRG